MEENLQHKISESNLSSLGKAAGIIVGEVALLSTAVEVGSKLEKKRSKPNVDTSVSGEANQVSCIAD